MIDRAIRYIDPLFDFSFKKIFGSEPNKDLLISFLNEIFKGRKRIVNIKYSKNDHPGDIPAERGAIFDVLCTGDKGEHFLIEVQRGKQENFRKRALFYASRHISSQVPKGDRYNDWKYDFPEIYVVAILVDFNLEKDQSDHYLRRISFCDEQTTEIFYEELGFVFIELRNFTKKQNELVTDLDKWLFLLKHMSKLEDRPNNFEEPVFKKLFNVAAYSN